jgi:aspartate aminotransferase
VLRTNADVRHYLLTAAGVGVVPFQAFGMPEDSGWFRLSVGAVATEEIRPTLARLEEALRGLGPGTAHAGEDAPRRVAAGDAR